MARVKLIKMLEKANIKENATDRVKMYRKAIVILSVIMAILFFLFLVYFMIDYSTEHWGLFFNL